MYQLTKMSVGYDPSTYHSKRFTMTVLVAKTMKQEDLQSPSTKLVALKHPIRLKYVKDRYSRKLVFTG